MLEKIGLPPKPSARGSSWVVDASHCQLCTSQFTLFNRKHHCRRCGGLFCGNCTQQRMVLRGQGDGPVRICDPCKKLEDATRFEARHGLKNRASAGGSRTSSKMEVDLLVKQLESNESSLQVSVNGNSVEDDYCIRSQDREYISNTGVGTNDHPSNSKSLKILANEGNQGSVLTPQMLRQHAMAEKRKWMELKRDGKGEEAMLAFKKGKELEQRAEALELSIRRSQRRVAASTTIASRQMQDDQASSTRRRKIKSSASATEVNQVNHASITHKLTSPKVTAEKDDFLGDLKELGWSEVDLQNADKEHGRNRSVESEIADLAAATNPSMVNAAAKKSEGGSSLSSMEVLAHKRRALALKREGKIVEAKEELKKAKILEKQLEEQEIGGREESDDELAALIQGLEKGTARVGNSTHDNIVSNIPFSLDGLLTSIGDEDEVDETGVELTDSDMNDPDMMAALISMGWGEELGTTDKNTSPDKFEQTTSFADFSSLKSRGDERRYALEQSKMPHPRRGGLYESLGTRESFDVSEEIVDVTEQDMSDPYYLSALRAMGFEDEEPTKLMQPLMAVASPSVIEKTTLQQEILSLKKEALALKRAGKIEAAKEELRQAKKLEKQLQEEHAQHVEECSMLAASQTAMFHRDPSVESVEDVIVENVNKDMEDPELAKTLRSLGWQDGAIDIDSSSCEVPTKAAVSMSSQDLSTVVSTFPSKKRSELQKELLGLKRSALKLRREGRSDEADEELKKAQVLEQQMQDLENTELVAGKDLQTGKAKGQWQVDRTKDKEFLSLVTDHSEDTEQVTEDDMKDPDMLAVLQSLGWDEEQKKTTSSLNQQSQMTDSREGLVDNLMQSEEVGILNHSKGEFISVETEKALQKLSTENDVCTYEVYKDDFASEIESEKVVHMDDFHSEYIGIQEQDGLMFPLIESQRVDTNAKGVPSLPATAGGTKVMNVKDELSHSTTVGGTGVMDLLTGHEWMPVGVEESSDGVDAQALLVENLCDTSFGTGIENLISKQVQISCGSIEKPGKNQMAPREEKNTYHPVEKKYTEKKYEVDTNVTSINKGVQQSQRDGDFVPSVETSLLQDLQQKILAHKREALSLKHEGKKAEAKEELRQAKLLEKRLECHRFEITKFVDSVESNAAVSISDTDGTVLNRRGESSSTLSSASDVDLLKADAAAVVSISASSTSHIPVQKHATKDRLKLQQESLGHKRKALTLRREGKMEEAEAEFELAKSIEKQMEGEGEGGSTSISAGLVAAPGIGHQAVINEDDALSLGDDIFDPQLLSALKGLGWKDSEIYSNEAPKVREAVDDLNTLGSPSRHMGNSSIKKAVLTSSAKLSLKMGHHGEMKKLEEKIKAEKVHAVQLKRLGRQSEALEVLRGAKLLERELKSMAS